MNKSGSVSIPKLLAGSSSSGAAISLADLLATLTSGGALSNIELDDVVLYGGTADGLILGSTQPSDGTFLNINIGKVGLPGGFILYGSGEDSGGNATGFVTWDGVNNIFQIYGGLTVTEAVRFGNLVIVGNNLQAVNDNGNVNLVPQSSLGSVNIVGNLNQTSPGNISFPLANAFTVLGNTLSLISIQDNVYGSENGVVNVKSDCFRDPVSISSVIYNSIASTVTVVATTILQSGQDIVISGTGSIDGRYTIIDMLSASSFTILITHSFISLHNIGLVTPIRFGRININAGSQVNFTDSCPLTFGSPLNTYQPFIESKSSQDLFFNGRYVTSYDPIITLQTQTGVFSDSGIAVKFQVGNHFQTGFFGFESSTQNFTWIPDATITLTPTGKMVTGQKGSMSLSSLSISSISGDPDLTLSAPNGNVIFDTKNIIIPTNIPIQIGPNILESINGNLLFQLQNNLNFTLLPGKSINIPQNVFLSFGNNESIVGTPTGLNITSSINVNGGVNLPLNNTIVTDPNGNLSLNSPVGITFNALRLYLPEDVFFQFGNNSTVGLHSSLGATYWHTVGDTNFSSNSYINLTSILGKIYLNSQFVILPDVSEIDMGAGNSISTIPYNLTAGDTYSISAQNYLQLNQQILNLNSSLNIQVPDLIPLNFGPSCSIVSDNQTLIVTGLAATINANVTINGSFQINGPTSYIQSSVTVISDPVLQLGGLTIPVNDIRDRGLVYKYYNSGSPNLGFIGFKESTQRFLLSMNGTISNDIYTPITLGNLEIDTLYSSNINTSNFTVGMITGNPDLVIAASNLFLSATSKIIVPVGINFTSGNTFFGATDANTFTITAQNVSLPSASLSLGSTTLTNTDVNNFHIGNVQNIYLDSNVTVGSALTFGTTGVSIQIDQSGNIDFVSSLGGQTNFTGTAVLNGGMNMGVSSLVWSNTLSELIWSSGLPNTLLNLSIRGNILDATWQGNPITLSYGGTGHVGAWHARSVVFVGDSGTSLDEDVGFFVYNHVSKCLGINTASPTSAITIGSGNLDLYSGLVLYRFPLNDFYSFSAGQIGSLYGISGALSVGVTDYTQLVPLMLMNHFGQVGIGMSQTFMNGLSGLSSESLLYVGGDINLNGSGVHFSNTEYINGANGSLNFFSAGEIIYNANVLFNQDVSFLELNSKIFGTAGGILNIQSDNKINMNSPHVIFQHHCCLHHDLVTDTCELYLTREANNILSINNLVQDIFLNPLNNIILANGINILLGSNSVISSSPGNLNLTCNGLNTNINLVAADVNILNGSTLNFANVGNGVTTTFNQDNTNFTINCGTPVLFNTTSITIPTNSKIIFDATSNSNITYTGSSLVLSTPTNINLNTSFTNILNSGTLRFYNSSAFASTITQTSTYLSILASQGINCNTSFFTLPNLCPLNFGSSSFIESNDSQSLLLIQSNIISLNATNVQLNQGNLTFYNGSNTFNYNLSPSAPILTVTGDTIDFNVQKINLPYGTPINFGSTSNYIEATPDNLIISSPDMINLISNNVHISGNLIVDKLSTFTIESESMFDSGILQLSPGNLYQITMLNSYLGTFTLVTVNNPHNLVAGDSVIIFNSVPNIDGTYIVSQVPSFTSFSISITFPGIPTGAVTPFGNVKTPLTIDNGSDSGVEFHWNSGNVNTGSMYAQMGFFGFRRSTQCFTFIPNATRIGNTFVGDLGNLCCGVINASNGINSPTLLSNLNCSGYQVSGSNFVISGGSIDNTPIGFVTPSVGYFTNLHVGDFNITGTGVINNLNAQYLNGFPSTAFLQINGSTPLTSDWNAGSFNITTGNLTDTSLNPTSIVYAGTNGLLVTDPNFTFSNDTLNVSKIGSVSFVGNVNFNNFQIQNASFVNGTISSSTLTNNTLNNNTITNGTISSSTINTSNITISSGNVLNATQGTVLFSNGQLSGNILAGGLAQIDITGNANTVTNGLYTTDYGANSLLVANNAGAPYSLTIPEGVFLGRLPGGQIAPLPFNDLLTLLNGYAPNLSIGGNASSVSDGVYTTDYIDNSILKANVAGLPFPLVVNEETFVGRLSGGVIASIPFTTLVTDLGLLTKSLFVPNSIIYENNSGQIQNLQLGPNEIIYENSSGTLSTLTVPIDTFVGRGDTGEITALTVAQVTAILNIQQGNTVTMQSLYDNGALLRSGNSIIPNGGTMSASLFLSFERIYIATGQVMNIPTTVDNVFIYVSYSQASGRIAILNLPAGVDGQHILLSVNSMDEYAALQVNCSILFPGVINPSAIAFISPGQNINLIYDAIINSWILQGGSGCSILTNEDILNPNWPLIMTGELDPDI